MAFEYQKTTAHLGILNLDSVIVRGRRQQYRIIRPNDRVDPIFITLERRETTAYLGILDLDSVIA